MEKRRLLVIGVEGPEIGGWIPEADERGTVVFGLPFRQEDDTERALHVAYKEQNEERRMVVKEVEIEFDKDSSDRPRISWSDTFSQDISALEPGDILVAPEIAHIYDRLFLFEHVEEENREYFFLRGKRRRPSRVRGVSPVHAPLIGRQPEMKRFSELLDQVKFDQGQICGFVGSAGIGKTRLVMACRQLLHRKNIPYIEAASLQRTSDGWEPFRNIIKQTVGAQCEDLGRLGISEGEGDFLRFLVLPFEAVPRLKDLTERQLQQGVAHSLRKLLRGMGKSPHVLFFEDVHRYSADALELLTYVLEDIESTRLLIVVSHRLELTSPWAKRLNYHEFQLSPFEEIELVEFLKLLLKVDRIPEPIVRRLVQLTMGNPLFAEEFVRQLQIGSGSHIETTDDGLRMLRISEKDLQTFPTTLHSVIAARFDRASEEEKEVLRCAALLGQPFQYEELRDFLARHLGERVKEVTSSLVSQEYLHEVSVFPSRIYRFTHDLVLDVVRESFSRERWAKDNASMGHFLRNRYSERLDDLSYRIAEHFLESHETEEAIQEAVRAGDYALSRHQYAKASYFHHEALRRWETDSASNTLPEDIYSKATRSFLAVGSMDRARDTLKKWKKRLRPKDRLALEKFALLEMKYQQQRSEFSEVLASSKKVLEQLGATRLSDDEWTDLHQNRIHALLWTGHPELALKECHAWQKKIEKRSKSEPRFESTLRPLKMLCSVVLGQPVAAKDLSYMLNKIESFDVTQNHFWTPMECLEAGFRLIAVLRRERFLDRARALAEKMIHLASECGLRQEQVRNQILLGFLEVDLGFFSKGLNTHESALEMSYELKDRVNQLQALSGITDTLLSLGAVDEAETLRPHSSTAAFHHLDPWQRAYQSVIHGYSKEMQGAYEEAATEYRSASKLYTKAGDQVLAQMAEFRSFSNAAKVKKSSPASLRKQLLKLSSNRRFEKVRAWKEESAIAWLTVATLDPSVLPKNVLGTWKDDDGKWTAQNRFRFLTAYLAYARASEKKSLVLDCERKLHTLLKEWEPRVPDKYVAGLKKHPLLSTTL